MHLSAAVILPVVAPALVAALPATEMPSLHDLAKRAGNGGGLPGGSFADFFPDCTDDPSYAKGTSQYKDGDGRYEASSCDNGMTTPAVNRFHCWTDMFVVSYQAIYRNWQNTGQVIDCSTTSSCAEAHINLNQSCTVETTTWDNTFGGAIQADWTIWTDKLALQPSLSYDHSFGGNKQVQICTQESNSGTCNWTDQKCHAVWAAQRNILVNGYIRRSCNTPRSGTNVPNSAQRSDGYYTVGMQDFSFELPNNEIVGCGAMCGDTSYPDPTPDNEAPVTIPTN